MYIQICVSNEFCYLMVIIFFYIESKDMYLLCFFKQYFLKKVLLKIYVYRDVRKYILNKKNISVSFMNLLVIKDIKVNIEIKVNFWISCLVLKNILFINI